MKTRIEKKRTAETGNRKTNSTCWLSTVCDFTPLVSRLASHATVLFALASALWVAQPISAQVRSGAAFLKILPGTRQQGLAGSLTGGIDEMHALYANPAATGFLREWQWGFNYTEWFADSYNLSITYGRRWRTPWSRDARIAFGLYYQGVRDFQSTDGLQPTASANDMLLSLSYGNPLTFLSRNLSIGGNVKFLRSKLADFTASAFVFDGGLLFRSNRIKLNTGIFDYGIISAGASATQLGQSLDFISEATPLPTTLRAGVAFNFGKHNGLQVQLSSDYQKTEDESGRFSFGAELGWGYLLALRTGYNFSNNILSKFSMGLSVRLDDLNSPIKSVLPGRNHALRVDVATLENNDFFSASYRGGLNYYPIAPEGFDITSEILNTCAGVENVRISWEMTDDPDLYDSVHYTLLVMREDSLRLAEIIEQVESHEFDLNNYSDSTLNVIRDPSKFSIDKKRRQMSYIFAASEGNYFSTVMATDADNHVRFAKKIERLRLPKPTQPDLLITRIDFHLNQNEILANGNNGKCHGEIQLTINNQSKCSAQNFTVNVYDSLAVDPRLLTIRNPDEFTPLGNGNIRRIIYQTQIAELLPGEYQTLTVPWRRVKDDADYIIAQIDEENVISESDETNNQKRQAIELPELDIKISAVPNEVAVGDTVTYTLRLENRGAATAKNFHLHNQIPDFLTLADSSFSLTPDSTAGESISWRFDALLPGEVHEITYLATVDSAVSGITNITKIFAPCDLLPINNSDSTVVNAIRYDLELTKTANVDPLRPKVNFNLNDSTLTASSLQQLDILGRALQSGLLKSTFIKIEGHTDLQGFRGHTPAQSRKRNQKLSEGRARAVKNYLVSNYNIAPERICNIGYGQERPISRVHEKNRRVEINILKETISCSAPVDPGLIIPAVYQQAIISYTLTIHNLGPDPAQDVLLIDMLPNNVSILPSSINRPPDNGSVAEAVRWRLPVIAAGERMDITFQVKVDSIPSSSHAYELKNAAHLNAKFDSNKNNNADASSVYAIAGLAPKSTSNGLRIHIVKPGESLSSIAEKYYKNPLHWRTIFAANQLVDENLIYPGQKIIIPYEPLAIQATSSQMGSRIQK